MGLLAEVSGNIGAFRTDLVRQVGGFCEDTLGEDLELTWRVYGAGYRVNFQPKALVYAESPSTMGGLWRQRVRWSRGLLQTLRMHAGMLGTWDHGPFGLFLIFNAVTMVLIPVLQLLILGILPFLYLAGKGPIPGEVLAILGWLGLFVSLLLIVFSIGLNKSWRDLRFVWTVFLWPFYSVFVGLALATIGISTLGRINGPTDPRVERAKLRSRSRAQRSCAVLRIQHTLWRHGNPARRRPHVPQQAAPLIPVANRRRGGRSRARRQPRRLLLRRG